MIQSDHQAGTHTDALNIHRTTGGRTQTDNKARAHFSPQEREARTHVVRRLIAHFEGETSSQDELTR